MKKIMCKVKDFFKDAKGYGTVELIIIIAALGLIATGMMGSLQATLVEDDNSAVKSVGSNIQEMVSDWQAEQ